MSLPAQPPQVLTVLQARMSSTRLPGKVLRPLAGAPMILRQIERVRRAGRIGRLVVATSEDRTDDVLADVLADAGVPVFRGSLDDVLGRFVGALEAFGQAEHVVRLTADCPLTDPDVIDAVIARHLLAGADYTSNALSRSFPRGLDVEVARAAALVEAAARTSDPYDREHVMPAIYRHPEGWRIEQLVQDLDQGELRWTVDRPDDLEFAAAVYEGLYAAKPAFDSGDVLAFVAARPELHALGGDRRI
jgi:spore coat polysaccharide biosynthesis protein SpsF